MAGCHLAAVRDPVKIRLTPVEGHVKPDRHPEIAGATQQEARQQAKDPSVEQSDPILTRVAMMRVAEEGRGENRGWPEAYDRGECKQRISTSAKFFTNGNENENECPYDGPFEDIRSVQCNAPERKDTNGSHHG